MQVTSFAASAVPPEELNAIAADYLRLEQARIFRQLLVMRCLVIAIAIAVAGAGFGLLPPVACWVSVGIFLAAPAWAWIVEFRRESQLSRRLESVGQRPRGWGAANLLGKKVVKSS